MNYLFLGKVYDMVKESDNTEGFQNHEELTESQIFEKIKEDLIPIQKNLEEQSITVDEAKSELKKINEWIQGTKLETQDKEEIGKAFEKLITLEKNIDENTLKGELVEIVKLLETLTKKDLADLMRGIKNQQNKQWRNPERPAEVQEGIEKSDKNFRNQFFYAAEHEPNPIGKWAAGIINDILEDDLT